MILQPFLLLENDSFRKAAIFFFFRETPWPRSRPTNDCTLTDDLPLCKAINPVLSFQIRWITELFAASTPFNKAIHLLCDQTDSLVNRSISVKKNHVTRVIRAVTSDDRSRSLQLMNWWELKDFLLAKLPPNKQYIDRLSYFQNKQSGGVWMTGRCAMVIQLVTQT